MAKLGRGNYKSDVAGPERRRIEELESRRAVEALLSELENPLQDTVDIRGDTYAIAVRGEAARALGRLRAQQATRPLEKLLGDPEFRVRQDAIVALMDIGDHTAVPAVAERLDDSHPYVQIFAARALGKMKDRRAVPALTRALSDENWRLRVAAAEALAKIGDDSGIAPIRQALRRERPWFLYRKLRLRTALRALEAQNR
jgi:HEAT repeat protein